MFFNKRKELINFYLNNNIYFTTMFEEKIAYCRNKEIKDSFCNIAYYCKNKQDVNKVVTYFTKKRTSPAYFADNAKLKKVANFLNFIEIANQNWWVNSHIDRLHQKFIKIDASNYELVEVGEKDFNEFCSINNVAFYATGNGCEEVNALQYTNALKKAFEKNKNLKLFLLKKDGKNFGTATLLIGDKFAYISNLIFLNEYRRTGAFKALKFLLDWLVQNNIKKVFVITQKNGYLDNIYKKLSFKKFYGGVIYSRKPCWF